MSTRFRAIAPLGVVVGWVAFIAGVGLMVVATAIYGDWYLIRRPWGDLGLGFIAWGLALAAVFAVVSVFTPVSWATVAALPGIAATGFLWVIILVMPLSGACCDQPPFPRDPGTILYSLPILIPLLAASTVAIRLPHAAMVGRRTRTTATDASA